MSEALSAAPSEQKEERRFKPLPIRVLVHDVASGETIREHDCDFNDPIKREWLTKLFVWAFCNQKSVELIKKSDDLAQNRA